MITFGKSEVVKWHKTCIRKIVNCGVKAMFVGYSNNHSSDTFRFIKEENKVVVLSRDYYLYVNIENKELESNKNI